MPSQPAAAHDSLQECATCGHFQKFHSDPTSGTDDPPEAQPCMSPEDGAPCTCRGFQAI